MANLSTTSYRNSLKKKIPRAFFVKGETNKKPVYKDRLNNKDDKKLKTLSPIDF